MCGSVCDRSDKKCGRGLVVIFMTGKWHMTTDILTVVVWSLLTFASFCRIWDGKCLADYCGFDYYFQYCTRSSHSSDCMLDKVRGMPKQSLACVLELILGVQGSLPVDDIWEFSGSMLGRIWVCGVWLFLMCQGRTVSLDPYVVAWDSGDAL